MIRTGPGCAQIQPDTGSAQLKGAVKKNRQKLSTITLSYYILCVYLTQGYVHVLCTEIKKEQQQSK